MLDVCEFHKILVDLALCVHGWWETFAHKRSLCILPPYTFPPGPFPAIYLAILNSRYRGHDTAAIHAQTVYSSPPHLLRDPDASVRLLEEAGKLVNSSSMFQPSEEEVMWVATPRYAEMSFAARARLCVVGCNFCCGGVIVMPPVDSQCPKRQHSGWTPLQYPFVELCRLLFGVLCHHCW